MSTQVFVPEFHPQNKAINKAVLAIAATAGCRIFLVGGYVRDAVLGRRKPDNINDFDYVVLGGSAVQLARQVSDALQGHFVLLDESTDTARVVFDDGAQMDFAGCLQQNLEVDIRRRDLTVNALIWDPEQPDVIRDDLGGLEDLKNKVVRLVSEQALIDDPLRLMRVYRFAATLDFQVEAQTAEMVARHASRLPAMAAERISYELFTIMESQRAAQTVDQMAKSGLLEIVFPELSAMHRVPPNSHHHLALFDHSLEVLRQTERSFAELPDWAQESFSLKLSQQITRYGATKLAALLHDVGKPATWVVAPDGRHTFIGHDKLGARICTDIARRLKWSAAVERTVGNLVLWHLRPGALFHQGPPTERALHRFYRNINDLVPQLILLAYGDFRGTCGPGLQEGRELLEKQIGELLTGYSVFKEGQKKIRRLLDGKDLMELLGLAPGPEIGNLLLELEEAQALGEIKDRAGAEAFVRECYRQRYSK